MSKTQNRIIGYTIVSIPILAMVALLWLIAGFTAVVLVLGSVILICSVTTLGMKFIYGDFDKK